jgi:hypothetical protein
MTPKPELRTIRELFAGGDRYTIPIYQRKYAWGAEQIEQLIRDIQDAYEPEAHESGTGGEENYFLGNVVCRDRTGRDAGVGGRDFEVVDGQQRLTTLHLLLSFLKASGAGSFGDHQGRLQYESRPKATEALRRIGASGTPTAGEASAEEDAAIRQSEHVIQQFAHQNPVVRTSGFTKFVLDNVTIVRAELPTETDLNRYFEIMNTRGQQLQQVDIVKARLMSRLPDDAERAAFAWVWNACSDMSSYVQMSLTPGDTEFRSKVFGADWTRTVMGNFDAIVAAHNDFAPAQEKPSDQTRSTGEPAAIDEALRAYAAIGQTKAAEDKQNIRYRSVIEYPSFLLHVLKLAKRDEQEVDGQLDDKKLVAGFEQTVRSNEDPAQWVRDFAVTLLRSRNFFDRYVLKRQYTGPNDENGDWSLQQLYRTSPNKGAVPGYRNTFSLPVERPEDDDDATSTDLLALQSMLRVTYTAPSSMHWITKVLRLMDSSTQDTVSEGELASTLREFARDKTRKAFFEPEEQPTAFDLNRIVFNYLDYLLLRDLPDAERRKFRFTFRNSIEHFYPQSLDEQMTGPSVTPENRDLLGNLALVSVGANSKFSNSAPEAKARNFERTIVQQSVKLRQMATIAKERGWDDKQVLEHHRAVVELLRRDTMLDQHAELRFPPQPV